MPMRDQGLAERQLAIGARENRRRGIRRRSSILLATLAGGLLLAGAAPAAASPGELIATFTEVEEAHEITSARTVGNVTMLSVASAFPEVLEGKLSGPFTEEFRVIVLPDGSAVARGTFTCDCTYEGRSGTVELRIIERIAPGFESGEGTWVAVGRSGGLRGLRGSGWLQEQQGHGSLFGRVFLT